jgi:hypothetical protein
MIDGIRVDARDQIEPTCRVPAVRIESDFMELIQALSNPVGPLKALLEMLPDSAPESSRSGGGAKSPAAVVQRSVGAPPRRPGWIVEAIVRVLANRQEPMQARAIHAAVEGLLGEPVRWGSVKGSLAANISGSSPRFVRVARGRYGLRTISAPLLESPL